MCTAESGPISAKTGPVMANQSGQAHARPASVILEFREDDFGGCLGSEQPELDENGEEATDVEKQHLSFY